MMLKDDNNRSSQSVLEEKGSVHLPAAKADTAFGQPKDGATVTVTREKFVDTIRQSLEKYHYVGPSQREDIILACRLREKKESVTILLCGTSGCGKSTLSSLLASRLGITTVVSTDSVRHMMRSFCSEKENPLLWASTYHAGECLDPVALAQAKARKKNIISSLQRSGELCLQGSEKKNDSQKYSLLKENLTEKQTADACISDKRHAHSLSAEQISSKELAVEGYKAQSEMVIDRLDSLITTWEDRKESVVVEGVHLSLNFVMGLMRKHPSVIPFLVYISNEEKHLERFAVRAKYMTLDPSKNKYVKYIRNIRTIQDYLCKRADKHLIPKVNNTNVDRSVASLHSTIFSCLRRRQMGTPFYDSATNTAKSVSDEYHKHNEPNAVGSKGMFRMIQRQDSLRRYMAVINDDGSINKAWPFLGSEAHLDTSSSGNDKVVGSPVYCPRNVCEIEHVHVQFGSFGLGSWPNDVEGSSCARSSNSSPTDIDEETSRYSSMASSPLHSNAHAKELVEEAAVSESEEEQFNEDDYSSDSTEKFEDDEIEGSVIESPAGSDEEYDENDDDAFHVNSQNSDGNNIKSFTRTLSIMPIKKIAAARGRLGRFKSMPLRRNCSIKRIKDKERQSSDD